ncbi:hypothetical protein DL766_003226 [Monosporascus sp. MC13-8B]|uniref:Trafficking protein particle complex subunit 6B n=1 Tax=Monosporascus cannonballus TaxID=155416 RepID=A0ABY0GYC6_9PEZI|nr:hypothetical protein DL762_007718 [Monosporascus cannonballus]RYO92509.1 hypothetical protein DL763_004638 [Monosporascus cannonballus]RYP33954.1 hypothetical protein DL766_003226 [Monosporascus sp. MC13-8B]
MSFDHPVPPFNAGDPSAAFLGASCLDFLLIELVPMAYRVTNEVEEQAAAASASPSSSSPSVPASVKQSGGGEPSNSVVAEAGGRSRSATTATTGTGRAGSGMGAGGSRVGGGSGSRLLDEDEERDAVFFRLEALGYRVGMGLVERFSRDRPRFHDALDAIKFVCKDLWMLVFRKQVDNLKTNHRGVYVLTDNAFRPLSRMSADAGGQAVVRAQPFLWFPCGILRGALAAMGISATVQGETNELPGAVFQIKTKAL